MTEASWTIAGSWAVVFMRWAWGFGRSPNEGEGGASSLPPSSSSSSSSDRPLARSEEFDSRRMWAWFLPNGDAHPALEPAVEAGPAGEKMLPPR